MIRFMDFSNPGYRRPSKVRRVHFKHFFYFIFFFSNSFASFSPLDDDAAHLFSLHSLIGDISPVVDNVFPLCAILGYSGNLLKRRRQCFFFSLEKWNMFRAAISPLYITATNSIIVPVIEGKGGKKFKKKVDT